MDKTPTLYGDYDLLIDQCLGGDRQLKKLIAQKDRHNRQGLQVLLNALKNRKVVLNDFQQRILHQCQEEQAFYDAQRQDLRNIRQLASGRYQARVNIEGNSYKQTFDTLAGAQEWRDRMDLLSHSLTLEDA
jgi:hypothetical protein